MSIPRYDHQFDYIEGSDVSRATFISPMTELNTTISNFRLGSISGYIVQEPNQTALLGINTGTAFDRNEIPYYWQSEKAFNLAEKIIEGTEYSSLRGMLSHMYAQLRSQMSPTMPSGRCDMSNDASLSSKRQGSFGAVNVGTFQHFTIGMAYSDYTFNPSSMSSTVIVQVAIGICAPEAFNENTGKWPTTAWLNSPTFSGTASGDTSGTQFEAMLDAFTQMIEKISFLPCAPCLRRPVTGGIQFSTNSVSQAWTNIMFSISNEPFIFEPLNLTHALFVSDSSIAQMGLWRTGGSVDPTPPEPGPEPGPDPDEPLPPPKPGPVDPPQPVDPIDPIPEPNDPPLDGTNCGIYSIYSPSRSRLRQLGEKLWDPNVWDMIKQYFTTPMDAVFSLAIIPAQPSTSGEQAIVIGNYNSHVGAPVVNSDYTTVNCGSVYIPKFFNSYLDYDPYTTYKLFLPFIGEVDLNADEITAQTITIKYKVNVVTGDCVAFVMKENSVFAEYNGNCARFLPLSSASYAAFIQATTAFAATAVTAGASLAGAGATGEAIESGLATSSGEMTGNGMVRLAGNVAAQQSIGANLASSGINAVMGSKMSYSKAGRVGQGAGQIAVRTPYITVTRPNLTLPEKIDQASSSALRNYIGYSTNKIGPLSSFSGFTVVEACQLSSQHATDSEIAEALSMMKGGIII